MGQCSPLLYTHSCFISEIAVFIASNRETFNRQSREVIFLCGLLQIPGNQSVNLKVGPHFHSLRYFARSSYMIFSVPIIILFHTGFIINNFKCNGFLSCSIFVMQFYDYSYIEYLLSVFLLRPYERVIPGKANGELW